MLNKTATHMSVWVLNQTVLSKEKEIWNEPAITPKKNNHQLAYVKRDQITDSDMLQKVPILQDSNGDQPTRLICGDYRGEVLNKAARPHRKGDVE